MPSRRSRRTPEVVPALVVGLGLLCVVVAVLAPAGAPSATGSWVTAPLARWIAAGLLLASAVVVIVAVVAVVRMTEVL